MSTEVPLAGLTDLGLSKGQKQKAHLLHIMTVKAWPFIFLDEATANIGIFDPHVVIDM